MTDTKKDGAKRPCVYMLRCKDGSLYTGWTNDFEKRLAAHQSGKGAKYTRSHLPVEPAAGITVNPGTPPGCSSVSSTESMK